MTDHFPDEMPTSADRLTGEDRYSVVIKVGGNELDDPAFLDGLARAVRTLQDRGPVARHRARRRQDHRPLPGAARPDAALRGGAARHRRGQHGRGRDGAERACQQAHRACPGRRGHPRRGHQRRGRRHDLRREDVASAGRPGSCGRDPGRGPAPAQHAARCRHRAGGQPHQLRRAGRAELQRQRRPRRHRHRRQAGGQYA